MAGQPNGQSSQQADERAGARADDRVVVIDERSRKVFHFFISLFPNYRDAGRSIGVGKDTIAKAFSNAGNVSFAAWNNPPNAMDSVTRRRRSGVTRDSRSAA